MKALRILIIEDEQTWQKILQLDIEDALNQVGKPKIHLEVSGTFDEGWKALTKDLPWNLVITDLALAPNDDEKLGIKLVDKAHNLHIPVIIVSAKLTEEDRQYFSTLSDVVACFSKGDYSKKIDKFTLEIQNILKVNGRNNSSNFDSHSLKPSSTNYFFV